MHRMTRPGTRVARRSMRVSLASVLIGACLVISVAPTLASHVVPVTVLGNPTCALVGSYGHEFKVEPVTDGLHADPASDFVVTLTTQPTALGTTVEFTANLPTDAVLAKGGPNANLYGYLPSVMTDEGLHPPMNDGTGTYYGMGHVRFCFTDVPSSSVTPTPIRTPPRPRPRFRPHADPDRTRPHADPLPEPTRLRLRTRPRLRSEPTRCRMPDSDSDPTPTPVSGSQPPASPTPEPPEPAEEENQPPQPSSSEQPAEMASPAPTPTPPTPAGLAFPPALPPAPGSDTGPTPPNELPPADVVGGVLAAAIQQVASMVKPEAAAVWPRPSASLRS